MNAVNKGDEMSWGFHGRMISVRKNTNNACVSYAAYIYRVILNNILYKMVHHEMRMIIGGHVDILVCKTVNPT